MKRHIVIGDIHGCFDELRDLLDRVAPSPDDVVISAGDVVRKGPAPERCLDLWRERGWLAILGNQEKKLLDLVRSGRVADDQDRRVAARAELLEFIRGWPLYADFEQEGFGVVHGGLLPGTPIEAQGETVLTLRSIRRKNGGWVAVPKGEEKPGDRFWTEVWDGPRTILYGHTPRQEVRRDRKAIGLDTSCVYGGALTAAVLRDGEWTFESVRARRRYARPAISSRRDDLAGFAVE
jgi:diadenosine tetraphosphatase ApaH/serine/threonine PP2A family protein phosphatase